MREIMNVNVNELKNSELFNTVNSRKELLVFEFCKEMSDKSFGSFFDQLRDLADYEGNKDSLMKATRLLAVIKFEERIESDTARDCINHLFNVINLVFASMSIMEEVENSDQENRKISDEKIIDLLSYMDSYFNSVIEENIIYNLYRVIMVFVYKYPNDMEPHYYDMEGVFMTHAILFDIRLKFYNFLNRVNGLIKTTK